MELNNIGYKGGSPRIRHKHNKKVIQPKIYDSKDSEKMIDVISNQYSKDTINKEDLNNFQVFLNDIIQDKKYTRNYDFTTTLLPKLIDSLEQLKGDNKINNFYLSEVKDGVEKIKKTITPSKPQNPPIEKSTESEDGFKLPTSYSNNSQNIRTPKIKIKVLKNLKAKEILKITETFKDYYKNNVILKDDFILFLKYLTDLKNGIIIDKTRKKLSELLYKSYKFINGAYNDGLLSSSQLLFIIQEIGIILNTTQPVIIKEKFIPNEKSLNIFSGYKK